MDNKEKARITYELLQQRKKRREKGKKMLLIICLIKFLDVKKKEVK